MRAAREPSREGRVTVGWVALITVAIAAVLGWGAQASLAKGVLLPGFDGDLAAWSPDSLLIATPARKEIELRRIDGSTERRLRGPGIDYFGWPCECSLGWTLDGERVQFISRKGVVEGDAVVGSVARDGGDLQRRSLGMPVGGAAWGPAGWPLVFIPNSRAFRLPSGKRVGPSPDLWRLESLHGKPRKILARPGGENDPLFSPDGSEITFMRETEWSSSLWKAGADGSNPRRLAGNLLGPSAAAWSPDGQQIALSTFSRGDRRCHLYVVSPSGGQLRQITDEEILTNRPAWTPDGQWITFSNYDGEIRKIRPDGTSAQTITRLPGKEIRGLKWSPDGEHLGYTARTFPVSD